jgi:glycerophosphoryl diester phosphodiesterase
MNTQVQLPPLIAHRGESELAPENTLEAFALAWIRGAVAIEGDFHLSQDGVLVCMHDFTLDRTTTATGKVSDYTWAELRKARIDGGTGWNDKYANKLRIATFKEYLKICKKYNLVPYVELKLISNEGIRKTIEMLHKMGFEGKYVLSSFKWHYLKEASKYSNAPLEHMKGKGWTKEIVDQVKAVKNGVARPGAKYVTEELANYCHEQGVTLECYGIKVGKADMVEKLRKLGVKGGTCNDWQRLGLDK